MKTVAVTGSSGFIGKYLTAALSEKSYKVIHLDISSGIDLLRKESIKDLPSFDYIIHLAARSFVPLSFQYPDLYYHDNYVLTLNVLELARERKAKVVFFSSYLYGPPQYLPVDENHSLNPHNPYAHSKLICESLCKGYNKDFGLPVIIFRPFNIYGFGQNDNFLIPSILKQLHSGMITIRDGRPKRDFIHVSDVVNAVVKSINLENYNTYETLNLASGESTSVKEVVDIIVKNHNLEVFVKYTNEYRQNEVLNTIGDTTKARKLLKWCPKIDINQGIELLMKKIQ